MVLIRFINEKLNIAVLCEPDSSKRVVMGESKIRNAIHQIEIIIENLQLLLPSDEENNAFTFESGLIKIKSNPRKQKSNLSECDLSQLLSDPQKV